VRGRLVRKTRQHNRESRCSVGAVCQAGQNRPTQEPSSRPGLPAGDFYVNLTQQFHSAWALSRRATVTGLVAASLAGVLLGACSTTVTKHGHLFQESDTQKVAPGMSQDQVRMALGTPTTTATVGGNNAFYYIGSTSSQNGFLTPVETDRKVYAVYFNPQGSVERSAQYGLKDGKVFDFSKNQTPSHARDESMLKALFRNLGTKQFGGE
jgi:outer membrane protein assembly factor BamE (lipoprotein component of BamABCDE complex)